MKKTVHPTSKTATMTFPVDPTPRSETHQIMTRIIKGFFACNNITESQCLRMLAILDETSSPE